MKKTRKERKGETMQRKLLCITLIGLISISFYSAAKVTPARLAHPLWPCGNEDSDPK